MSRRRRARINSRAILIWIRRPIVCCRRKIGPPAECRLRLPLRAVVLRRLLVRPWLILILRRLLIRPRLILIWPHGRLIWPLLILPLLISILPRILLLVPPHLRLRKPELSAGPTAP